jgi:hypothetical protein
MRSGGSSRSLVPRRITLSARARAGEVMKPAVHASTIRGVRSTRA